MKRYFNDRRPVTGRSDLRSIIVQSIERMDSAVLRETLSLGKDEAPLESCWQAELYRSLMETLPAGVVPSADVGQVIMHSSDM